MKMHILAAAFLTALAARGASASSEGGDTWSALEPVQRSTLVLQAPPHAAPTASGLDARWDGSEGGDTWSHLQALRQAGSGQASSEDRAASSDTGTASPTAATERLSSKTIRSTSSRCAPNAMRTPISLVRRLMP